MTSKNNKKLRNKNKKEKYSIKLFDFENKLWKHYKNFSSLYEISNDLNLSYSKVHHICNGRSKCVDFFIKINRI